MLVALPTDLAPPLRADVERLIAECGLAVHPPPTVTPRRGDRTQPVCHGCHQPGRMGLCTLPDGRVVLAHRRCHRRIHRRAAAAGAATSRRV